MIGALAIVVALSGSALAVKKNSVLSIHIRDGEVKSKDIAQLGVEREDLAAGSVESLAIRDDTVTGFDVDEDEVPGMPLTQGPRGPEGDRGPAGPLGPIGQQGPDGGSLAGPGGPATGDLAGSYPNPSIAPSAIGSAEILNGQINGNDLADVNDATPDGSVTSTKVIDGSLRLEDVAAFTETVNVPAPVGVNADSCQALVSDSMANYAEGDLVFFVPPPGTPAGLVPRPYQAAEDQRQAFICNTTAGALNVPAGNLRLVAFRP